MFCTLLSMYLCTLSTRLSRVRVAMYVSTLSTMLSHKNMGGGLCTVILYMFVLCPQPLYWVEDVITKECLRRVLNVITRCKQGTYLQQYFKWYYLFLLLFNMSSNERCDRLQLAPGLHPMALNYCFPQPLPPSDTVR